MKPIHKGPGILALALLMLLAASPATAAPPNFQGAGTFQGGGGALAAVPWPAHQAGDVGLLIIETANQAVTLGTNGGDWAEVTPDSPQGTGTAGGTAATRLTVFWSRATSSSMGAVEVLDSGNHQMARILTFRGVIATGNPWDVTAGDVLGSANVNVTIPGDQTTVADTLVVAIVASGIDNNPATPQVSNWVNADLSDLQERADDFDFDNNGGGFGVATGVKATAGTYAATTATLATATNAVQGRMSIALKPEPAGPAGLATLPFSYRKSITIDHNKVGTSGAPATLANYPFLFNVTDADLRAPAKTTYAAAGSYTFTVPAGVTSLTVKAWGAGGGAGGSNGTNLAGDGGGGGFASSTITVTPGEGLTIRVGGGGALGTAGRGGGGGGYSAVLRSATFLNQAGGGGGGGGTDSAAGEIGGDGGAGGGASGVAGGDGQGGTGQGVGGGGGTQSAGGTGGATVPAGNNLSGDGQNGSANQGGAGGKGDTAGGTGGGGAGGTHGGGAGGSEFNGGRSGGGGGGGGLYGGGGGEGSDGEGAAGAGGGSAYNASNCVFGCTAGSGRNAGNSGDADYGAANAGLGGLGTTGSGNNGNPGRIVLLYGDGSSGHVTSSAGHDIIFRALDATTCNEAGTVAIDDTSSNVGTTTIDVTHTVSGSNRLMLVGVSGLGSTPTVTSVTWDFGGSNPVNFVANLVGTTNAGGVTVIRIFSLVAPDTGTKTLRVVTSGGNNSVGVMSFTGVNQGTPLGTFAANQSTGAANATVGVTSQVGELVFDTVAVEDEGASLAAHASQAQQWQLDSGPHGGGGSTEAGAAGTVTMSWVHPIAQWSIGGVSIKPALGAGNSVCTLDHEIEQYDSATGKFVAWVRIPSVNAFSASSDTVIYIYYGNSEITSSTENPTGVWDSNFVAVYHMNQDPSVGTNCAGGGGTLELCDSTATNNDGNMNGAMTAADSVTESSSPPARIGKAIDFDGVDDWIGVASTNFPTTTFTFSFWVRPASCVAEKFLNIAQDSSNSDEMDLDFDSSCNFGGELNNTSFGSGSASLSANNYHYYHFVRSGTGTNQTEGFYNAGASPDFQATTAAISTSCTLFIGGDATSSTRCTTADDLFQQMVFDEFRISNIARDAHWRKTEYNNMTLLSCGGAFPFDATEFAICSGEESNPPSAVKLRGARAVAYEGSYAQTVQLKWRTSHEVDHLGFHVYREQAGQLMQLTPSLVAGSALLARGRTELTAGQRYSWWDVLPMGGGPLQYWLEEVDLHGKRTWHGPIAVSSAKGRRDLAKPEQVRSVLLSKLGRGKHKGRLPGAPWQGAADAATQTDTAAQRANQTQLAAGPAIKLGVSAEGWYRVDQPTLIAAGLDPKVDPRRLQLFADGREVPMVVTGAKDKRLQHRDAIEFYGVGLETPWTDTRTYWLVEGPQAGQRIETSQWRGRSQSGPASFPYTVTWQPRELYFAALRNADADNFFGPVVGNWPTEHALTLTHLDPVPPGAARLEVTLQGVTDGPHVVGVQVNGTSVGTVSFDGQGQGRVDLSVPAAQLVEGANLVTLMALGGDMDVSLVATVRLTYWHTYTAEEDVLRGSVPAGQQVTIGGFSTRPIYVVDVTEPDAVRSVPGQVKRQGSSFAVTVVGPGPGTRTLLAFTYRIAATPAKIYANQPSQWHSSQHRADLVMISHPAFLSSLAPLKAWREQQGWTVALIDVEDLYDEFTFGAKSPRALRALVATARAHWTQPPRFLLLGGDASFDPRDTQGMGETDFVPTKLIDTDMMETASDDWFGDLDGDGVAEVAVGRLAVRTPEEAATVVQKLIGYDQTTAPRTAVMVADTPDSLDFEGASTRLAELLPGGMATQAIYRSQSDDATTRGTLLGALNSGAWLVNYLGHGSVEVWRGEVFTSLDASTLTNGLRLPFVSTMTCLNGFFHDVYTESLAEALQRAPEGGALAVWASSSLSQATDQVDMNRALLKGLSAGLTVGEAVTQAKTVTQNPNVRRTWILFGDPTTRLK